MAARDNLQRLIDRKVQEINRLEHEIDQANVYLQALQDAMKSLPRENSPSPGQNGTRGIVLREGSGVYAAREAIKAHGKPLHINEILQAIEKPVDKKHRLSLASTLASYVRAQQVFTRTAPNTFGLIELGNNGRAARSQVEEELPESFGV